MRGETLSATEIAGTRLFLAESMFAWQRWRYIIDVPAGCLVCLAMVLALCGFVRPALAAGDVVLWRGESAGKRIEWTTANLTISEAGSGKVLFNAQDAGRANFEKLTSTSKPARYEEDYELLSVVGSLVSIEYHFKATPSSGDCAERTRYVTIDVSGGQLNSAFAPLVSPDASQRLVRLDDVFDARDVTAALKNDPVIQAVLDVDKYSDLSSLISALSGRNLPPPDMCGRFDAAMMNAFCIHHLRANKAVVRLGVSGSEKCPAALSELGFAIAVPDAWMPVLRRAQSGTEGILAGTLKKLSRSRCTHLEFDPAKKGVARAPAGLGRQRGKNLHGRKA